MSFYTDLDHWHRPVPFSGQHVTTAPVIWDIGRKGSGFRYVVPIGFRFDVSIPWPLRPVLNPQNPRFMKAACLHDHMLASGWNRITAGAVFHQALKADGVGGLKRLAMWLAVSLWRYK